MKTLMSFLSVLLLLTAFVNTSQAKDKTEKVDLLADLSGKKIAVMSRKQTDIQLQTVGGVLTGAVFGSLGAAAGAGGGALSSSTTASISSSAANMSTSLGVEESKHLDPGLRLRNKFGNDLISQRGGERVESKVGEVGPVKFDWIIKNHSDADYVVDVYASVFVTYYRSNFSRYRLIYVANANVIDVANKSKISETKCEYLTNKEEMYPTRKELFEDNEGALYIKVLDNAFNHCVATIYDKLKLVNKEPVQ